MATTTAPGSLKAIPPADFGSRFSAFVIDAVILFAAQWVVFIVLSRQLQAVGFTSTEPCEADALRLCEGPSAALWAVLLLLLLASTIGYYAFFEGRHGATPGKRAMGLQVVSTDGEHPIGLVAATLRAVVRQSFWLSLFFVFDASPLGLSLPAILFIALPVAAFALVGYGAVAADGRGVHDLVAGTQVVRQESVPIQKLNPEDADHGDTDRGDTDHGDSDQSDADNSDDVDVSEEAQ